MTYNDKNPIEHSRRVANHLKNMAKGERRRQIRSEKKKQRRNLKPRSRDNTNWTPDLVDDWDDLDYNEVERIMPRDEAERRRSIENAAFKASDTKEQDAEAVVIPQGAQQGIVVSVSSGICQIDVGGRILQCTIRGSLSAEQIEFTNVVAAGDDVAVTEDSTGNGIVEVVLPRRSILARPDVFYGHLRQIIVANAEQLLIVASWRDPVIWLELIDRYLIAAERSNLRPIICVNKADLIESEAEFEDTVRPYKSLDYRVIRTSAYTGEGIDDLRDALKDSMTVLTGMSGTGKSSLISAAQPGLNLRTSEVSDWSGEGRHTTTQATIHKLEMGGSVVDTPGIREFGLSGLRRYELSQFFPEIAALEFDCRFMNCSHIIEPDCAVQAGEAKGLILPSRYHSYKLISDSLPD